MKRVILTSLALLLATGAAFAQQNGFSANVHIFQNVLNSNSNAAQSTVMFEGGFGTQNSFTYALLDGIKTGDTPSSTYMQLFHEQKFWEAPIFLHLEYRNVGSNEESIYLGAAFNFFTKHGMIAVEPLLKNSSVNFYKPGFFDPEQSALQLSFVTGFDWGKVNFNSFSDFWSPSLNYRAGDGCNFNAVDGESWGIHSEGWLYYRLFDHLQVGTIFALGYNDYGTRATGLGFGYSVSFGIKIN